MYKRYLDQIKELENFTVGVAQPGDYALRLPEVPRLATGHGRPGRTQAG